MQWAGTQGPQDLLTWNLQLQNLGSFHHHLLTSETMACTNCCLKLDKII